MTRQVPSRNRYIALTGAAGIAAAISAIVFVGAPPIPAAMGIGLAICWLIWRAPAQ
jgi:methylthioribose-1-phosphate isomerase